MEVGSNFDTPQASFSTLECYIYISRLNHQLDLEVKNIGQHSELKIMYDQLHFTNYKP